MAYEKELNDLFLMQQTYATLFAVQNKIQSKSDESFETLSTRQFMTMLAVLHLMGHEPTVNNIARKLGTSKQNANQLVSVLKKKGYVEITQSKTDKRAYNVVVTSSGLQETMRCNEIGILLFADIFEDFTGEELLSLWNLLKKLYRFDGEEQQGFEENLNDSLELDETSKKAQLRTLQAFAEKRNSINLKEKPRDEK